MKKKSLMFLLLLFCLTFHTHSNAQDNIRIHMAIEFVDHAASALIARHKSWFKQAGLEIRSFDNYVTGMALSAALGRGDINVAYICLIPAISAYANAKIPIRIVAGTHKYGYGLLVDTKKIKTVQDLEKPDIRIGCAREGSPVDILLHKMIEKYRLDRGKILPKVRRMPPPKLLLALKLGRLDASFCSEQFPSMGEKLGFKELIRAPDLWPNMQGSVLAVRQDLIERHPEVVRKLIRITRRGIDYIKNNPEDAARIVAHELTITSLDVFPSEISGRLEELQITPEVIRRSLSKKMINTILIDPKMIQETINYMAKLGYLRGGVFPCEQILDLRFFDE